jgi:hypothetical protein
MGDIGMVKGGLLAWKLCGKGLDVRSIVIHSGVSVCVRV